MRAVKPRPSFVRREIQVLIRTFPSVFVTITRNIKTYLYGQQRMVPVTVFSGEVLVIPASGTVERYGLGQVENTQPQILVAGKRDIQQGDFVVMAGVVYQVEFAPAYFDGFMTLRLAQYQQ